MPQADREAYAREVDKQIGNHAVDSPEHRIMAGIRAYLTERHAQDAKPVYTGTVDETPTRSPDFGKRIGAPRLSQQANGSIVMETVGGRRAGETIDRPIWRIEKRDGVWGVYPMTEQSPASHSTTTKRKAERWALDRANGVPENQAVWKRSANHEAPFCPTMQRCSAEILHGETFAEAAE